MVQGHRRGGAYIGWAAMWPLIVVMFNMGVLIWGAATIKAAVYQQEKDLVKFGKVVELMQTTQASIVMELAIVAERQRVMQVDVVDHNNRLDKIEGR